MSKTRNFRPEEKRIKVVKSGKNKTTKYTNDYIDSESEIEDDIDDFMDDDPDVEWEH